jgi:hypothetical protein
LPQQRTFPLDLLEADALAVEVDLHPRQDGVAYLTREEAAEMGIALDPIIFASVLVH